MSARVCSLRTPLSLSLPDTFFLVLRVHGFLSAHFSNGVFCYFLIGLSGFIKKAKVLRDLGVDIGAFLLAKGGHNIDSSGCTACASWPGPSLSPVWPPWESDVLTCCKVPPGYGGKVNQQTNQSLC